MAPGGWVEKWVPGAVTFRQAPSRLVSAGSKSGRGRMGRIVEGAERGRNPECGPPLGARLGRGSEGRGPPPGFTRVDAFGTLPGRVHGIIQEDRLEAKEPGATESAADPLTRWLLLAALGLGLVRFLWLGSWSLWLDEAFTLSDVREPLAFRNPLGYWLFGAFYEYAAERPSETVLRLPAAVSGWLCIPASYWGLRYFIGRRSAAVAALWLALSPWHLYWSQNARFYTLAQLLCLLGGGCVFRGISKSGAPLVLLGVGFLTLSGLTHPSAAMLAGGLLVVPLVLGRAGRWPEPDGGRRAWGVLAAAAIGAVLVGGAWAALVWLDWSSVENKGAGSPVHFVLSAGYFVSPLLGLAFCWGALEIWSRREHRALVLLACVVLGLSLALFASLFRRSSAQYVFVFQPWIAAVAAYPFGARASALFRPRGGLWSRLGAWPRWSLALVVAAPLAFESVLYFTVRNGDRYYWREAYAYVFEHRQPSDLVAGMQAPVGEYYLNPLSGDLRDWKHVVWLDPFRARLPEFWSRYERRTWFIFNREYLFDWGEPERLEFERVLREECRLVKAYRVPWHPRDLDVLVYLRDYPER